MSNPFSPARAGGPDDPHRYEAFIPGQEDDGTLDAGRRADRIEAVREAVDGLPAPQRQYLQFAMQGISQRSIAEFFGVSEAAVSQTLGRARAALQKELAGLV